MNTIIYVGRWDLLREEWGHEVDLGKMTRQELRDEIGRQIDIATDDNLDDRDYIGAYSPKEFEDEFNGSHPGWLSSENYFVKLLPLKEK